MSWLRRNRAVAGAITGGFWLLVVTVLLAGQLAGGEPTPSPSPVASERSAPTPRPTRTPRPTPPPTPAPAATCPLSGLAAGSETVEGPALVVQIENHPNARPASNLSLADLVVEAPVEGDTTRFSAVYLCTDVPGGTGPVRSARYYNVDLWQDLRALTVGFGASGGANQRFSAAGMPYVNGITGQWPWFSRIAERAAPHNVYVDLAAMRGALGSDPRLATLAERVGPVRAPFSFDADPALPAGRDVGRLEIRTNPSWVFGWRWDATLDAWRRSDANVEIVDATTGGAIAARSVIVQRVSQEIVYGDPDPAGNPRRLQHMVGSGVGTAYVDGHAIDITWSRATAADGTTWSVAETGAPLVLPPGRVWWEIVPTGAAVSES